MTEDLSLFYNRATKRVDSTDSLLNMLQKLGIKSVREWGFLPSAKFVHRYEQIERDRKNYRYE